MSVTLLLISWAATSVRVSTSTAESAHAITMMRAIPACPRSPLRKPLIHTLLEGGGGLGPAGLAGEDVQRRADAGADVAGVGLDVARVVQEHGGRVQVRLDRRQTGAGAAVDGRHVAENALDARGVRVVQDPVDCRQTVLSGHQRALG